VRTPRPAALAASAQETAERIASAFESADVDRIAALATPKCWLEVIVEPGGGSAQSVSDYLAQLRTRFAAGLRVRAERVLQSSDMSVRSQWAEAGRTYRVDLRLREVDGRWYWGGLYQFQPN
jgi:hypothetical protein